MSATGQTSEGGVQGSSLSVDTRLDETRINIGKFIFWSFPILLLCTIGALVFLFLIVSGTIGGGREAEGGLSTVERMALAGSVQVAFGMVMGFVSVFMGLMMTWFGLSASYAMTAKSGKMGEVSLQSASPGLLFFLGGVILIGVSLYKPLTYEDHGSVDKVPISKDSHAAQGVTPRTPPPVKEG